MPGSTFTTEAPRLAFFSLFFVLFVTLGQSVGCGTPTNQNESTTEKPVGATEKFVDSTQPDASTIQETTHEQLPDDKLHDVASGEMIADVTPDVAQDVGPSDQGEEALPETPVQPEETKDAGTENVLTWWECRRMMGSLTAAQKALCDKLHKTPLTKAKYAVRWVFLYDTQGAEAWIKPRLDLLNQRFAKANMSFTTHSTTILKSTALATNGEYDNRNSFTLQQLKDDIISLLGLSGNTTAANALDAFKKRLSGVGVLSAQVQRLTLNLKLAPNAFLNRIARAEDKEIWVFVAKKLISSTGKTPGGYASLPSFEHRSINRGSIFMKEQYREDALAHEFGHYFGLTHTQATQATLDPTKLLANACKTRLLPGGVTDIQKVLRGHFGADYKKSLGQPFVPYDVSAQGLSDFRKLRCAVGGLWIHRINTFQKPTTDKATWKNFASFADFAKFLLDDRKPVHQKLFPMGGAGYNCRLGTTSKKIECTFDGMTFLGDQPLLTGSIAFQQGKASNLMSYLNNKTSFPVRLLAPEQDEMLTFHARTADRLALQNLLLTP